MRSGIFKILSEDPPTVDTTDDDEAARGGDVTDFRQVGETDRISRYIVSDGNVTTGNHALDDEATAFAEKHEFEVIELPFLAL